LKSIAIVAEDLSLPLDEGFKKASALTIASIAGLGTATHVFARRFSGSGRQGSGPSDLGLPGVPAAAGRLPANRLLLGPDFSRRLRDVSPDAILYIPEAAATLASLLRARLIKLQAGGRPVAVLSLQRRGYPALAALLARPLRPDLALVLSGAAASTLEGLGIAAACVPLGVDTAVFRPAGPGEKRALRQKHGITADKVILHVGHVARTRNLGSLLGALVPGRQMVVVSSTATRQDREVAKALRSSSVVLVDRFLEDVSEVYRLADCYAFPTRSSLGAIELPLSVLEAMAVNLPVVTTAFGGIPDFFKEGRGFFLASSEEEFARKIELALDLGPAGAGTRAMVEDFTWDKAARRMLDAIEKAIGWRDNRVRMRVSE
jgi:glycosyltransferase involved in cell wall biosynthesis